MKRRKLLCIVAGLFAVAMPALAVFTGMDLDATLSNLRRELFHDYEQKTQTQERLQGKYEAQHRQMVDIVKKCNDLSLMLYSQKQDYTFDISYALEKVSKEYMDFNKNRTPYDRIVSRLDIEINRYARLIESLRRLPPELVDVEVVPDSLAYHNDTLDAHLEHNESLLQQELQEQVEVIHAMTQAKNASSENRPAFILSEQGQIDRDTCLFYASELLKMYAASREMAMADSIHYREAQLRMEESYKYARDYYGILEKKVFIEGQTPWKSILANPGEYWKEARRAIAEKFSISFMKQVVHSENEAAETLNGITPTNDTRVVNSAKVYWLLVYIAGLFILWALAALILLPVFRLVKPIKSRVAKEQKPYFALLLACVLFIILSTESTYDDITRKAMSIMQTFICLLMAINTALLIRLEPSKLKGGIRIYLPVIFTAFFVISCRVLFVPNAFLNFFFPPLLLIMTVWQLVANLRNCPKADRSDAIIGWTSLGITGVAMVIGWTGYIFLALIILVWWYFQLALILAVLSVRDLTFLYKDNRLEKRLSEYREKITYVTGPAKDKLMFGATWFYDLIREVLIPVMVMCSIPACIYWALNIFEFNDLYHTIFDKPFLRQGGPEGFCVSLYSLLQLAALFCLFKYLNKAIHTVWQAAKYRRFLRKYNRKTVRNNEINLALGNSLISVFVWFVYADIVIITLNIPTGSLGLIAGGLSAGIGLALKDIINNFIYGIQLMGGRLRVGDWIDCDGVRG